MALTKEQEVAAKAAIGLYLKTCAVCGARRFALNPEVTFLPTIQGDVINPVRGQPCLSVVCQTCGHVFLFNAFRMGLGELLGIGALQDKQGPTEENG
jgi:hypothetical protein